MPFHGQLRQLRAWSDHPGCQGPRAKKGGVKNWNSTKICQKDKNDETQKALAATKNKRTHARRTRCRHAKLHAQEAIGVQSPHVTQRGGDKKKRREECGVSLGRPFAASSNRSKGAKSKTKKYGKSYTPHG